MQTIVLSLAADDNRLDDRKRNSTVGPACLDDTRSSPHREHLYREGMSSQSVPLLITTPAGEDRLRLIRRVRTLSLLSIGWMTVEAGVAIVFALTAGSIALLAFGLDSLIELASASTILWLYTGSRGGSGTAGVSRTRRRQGLLLGAVPSAVRRQWDSRSQWPGGGRRACACVSAAGMRGVTAAGNREQAAGSE